MRQRIPWFGMTLVVLFVMTWSVRLAGAEFEILWDSTFGGTARESVRAIARAQDGYLILGLSSSTNGNKTAPLIGIQDYWIVKVDDQGRKIWDRTYGLARAYSEPRTIQAIGDGKYLVGGTTDAGLWLFQIEETGEVLWERYITGAELGTISKIEPTPGGYFLTGKFSHSVVRTDSFGRKIWIRSFGEQSQYYYVSSVAATADGGCLVGLSTQTRLSDFPFGFGFWDFWVIKLDADGAEEWQEFYGTENGEQLHTMAADGKGNFYLAGTGGLAPWLVKIDGAGKKLWDLEVGGEIKVTADGGCLLSSTQQTIGPTGTVILGPMLYKVSASGAREWTFHESSSDGLLGVEVSPDGDIILEGETGADLFKRDYRIRKLHVNNLPPGTPRIYLDGVERATFYSATNQAVLEIKSSLAGAPIHYTLDGSEPGANSTVYVSPVTLTNDATIRASVLREEGPLSVTPVKLTVFHGYRLTLRTNGGGTINISPELPAYFPSNVVTAIATPAAGWSFSHWTGYLQGRKDNPAEFAFVFDQEIGAAFTTELALEASPLEGSIRTIPSTSTLAYGTTLTLAVVPTNGFYFKQWTGAVDGSNNPVKLDVLMPNPSVRAEFAQLKTDEVAFVAIPNGDGAISQSPAGNAFIRGQEIMLRAVPAHGASFLGWLGLSNRVETSELKLSLEQSTAVIGVFSGGDTSMFGDIVHLIKPTILTNLFVFQVSANTTNSLIIESSIDLKKWTPLTNSIPEVEVQPEGTQKFFRANFSTQAASPFRTN